MQLFRILQSQGIGSRRECLDLILGQQVSVNGALIVDPKHEFCEQNLVFDIAGESFEYRPMAYLVMHKPAGYECSRQSHNHPSVFSLLPEFLLRRGVQCVGRLDQDTTGLLLFSDDGQFIHELTSPKKQVGKTYQVTCKHEFDASLIEQLLAGVLLHDEPLPLRARQCTRLANNVLQLVINEGKYHQVKRMLAAAGNRVDALHRIAIGDFTLPDDIASGTWKWLSADDLNTLKSTKLP